MHNRSKVEPELLRGVSQQLAGIPVTLELAEAHVEILEPLMRGIDELRKLPLKEIVPPLAFMPEEDLK